MSEVLLYRKEMFVWSKRCLEHSIKWNIESNIEWNIESNIEWNIESNIEWNIE